VADPIPLRILADLDAKQNVSVSGSLSIHTTSSFVVPQIITSSGNFYDVDAALHRIDEALQGFTSNIANAVGGVVEQLNYSKYTYTGSFDNSGTRTINLTTAVQSGSTYFSTADLDKISVDVLIDTNGDGKYYNDLVSCVIFADAGNVKITLDGPQAANKNFRLIVANEKTITGQETSGSSYPAGPQGPSGSVGPQGPSGSVGPQGPSGSQGATGKSYITVAFNRSTTSTIDAVATNFSLTPSRCPNGFNLDITGFSQTNTGMLIASLYALTSNSFVSSGSINSINPTTITLSAPASANNPEQYELRFKTSGSNGNTVYIQTAIAEIL